MKILHTSDIHCCKEHERDVMISLREINASIEKHDVDLIAVAGDWWDATVQNSEQGGLDRFLGVLQSMANKVPVVMVEGTPSHDVDGSLNVIKRLQSENGITVLEPGVPYILNWGKVSPADKIPTACRLNNQLLILGIPEPRKKHLLANGTTGKDATEEAVRDAMRLLCFQLAAIRKEYADLPCLVVYHGEVAGTTLQNDQTIERGTGIAITIDDLASIGADYVALGHIHKPQQVGTLQAYYAGSVYAKDFGETHKPGCNLVEIETEKESVGGDLFVEHTQSFQAKVTRIDFTHPQNLKITTGFPLKIPTSELQGRRVWVEVNCKKEDQALFDTDTILDGVMKAGAVPGSRVTVAVKASETVRAADITGTSITPEEKFRIWAEQSGVEVTDSLESKIKTMESETERAGITVSGEWALVSVRIRGAIGLWYGIKKDELFVNFDDFDNGLIALSGRNGKGKTTFIENCHVYPQLLTRKGTLKDHFRLKDSLREVIYRDVSTGAEKRFLIQIDGLTKSGGTKYFIFDRASSGGEWIPMPGVDGNLDPYKDAITSIFGPLELYLRTAFITQRPNKDVPDLTEATKTEKKMLFANLAGIDYLQKFADTAKQEADRLSQESHDTEIKIGILSQSVEAKPEVMKDIQMLTDDESMASARIETVKTEGAAARERYERLKIAANAERSRIQRAANAEVLQTRLQNEIAEIDRSICALFDTISRRSFFEEQVKRYEDIKAVYDQESEKAQEHEKQKRLKIDEFRQKMDAFNEKKRKIDDLLSEHKFALQKAISGHEAILKEIDFAKTATAEVNEFCPVCNQHLAAEKIAELNQKREEALGRVNKLQNEAEHQKSEIASLETRLNALSLELADHAYQEPRQEQFEEFNRAVLDNAKKQLDQLDIVGARNSLTESLAASGKIAALKEQVNEKKRNLVDVQEELAELSQNENSSAIADCDIAANEINELTEKYRQFTANLASIQATLEARRNRLAEIVASEAELKKLRESVKTAKLEFSEWDLLKRAFGPDGIQALELDALAPGIAEIANDILKKSFGDRFQIEFQTTRIAGKGKNTKQVEDFLIYVLDTTTGEATLLENKSGGEAVWIKRSIYSAFAIIRSRNTGFRFLTSFQDEADGALDAPSRIAYAAMLEAEHDTAKLKHTIIITHSEEVKAMIEQKIDMGAFTDEQPEAGEEVA